MTTPPELGQDRNAQRAWAKPVKTLNTGALPSEAVNLNVTGKQLAGPVRGFGRLWQKTYRIQFVGAKPAPAEVIREWKAHFGAFWPKGNRFISAAEGIEPGNVAVLNLAGPGGINMPGGAPMISTGILVIYADDESFSFMTPQGHMFAGMITFSAESEDDATCTQIQALIRANDPIYEAMFMLGGSKVEDDFWRATLKNVAARFEATGEVTTKAVCIDPRWRWNEAGNVWQNAAIRTIFAVPGRWAARLFKR